MIKVRGRLSYLSFSKRCASYLTAQAGLSPEKELVLAYVIEVLALNFFNIMIALVLGLLLGVLPGTATCIVTALLFRYTAGGAHSNSPWRCGVMTITVFPLIALLAVPLSMLKQPYLDLLVAAAVLYGLLAVILLAPVDSPSAPVVSPLRRKKLKALSVIVVLVLAALLVMLRQSQWVYARQVMLCVAVSMAWFSFMLGRQGHWLVSFVDSIRVSR